jgi:hypothetical protein
VEGVEAARVAAERVMRIAPDQPMSLLAMGAYRLNQKQDYTGALELYTRGSRSIPTTRSC